MALKAVRTVVALEGEELLRLQEILMDQDERAALAFLREAVVPKIRRAQDDSHRPEFEGGIRLGPGD